jgi:hypothetical protein
VRGVFAWLTLFALGACQDGPYPAPILGSTYRIDKDLPQPGGEVSLDIFTTEAECANAKIDEVDECRPQVDRASGEVRLSFDVRDPTTAQTLRASIGKDDLSLAHNSSKESDFELTPHDPQVGGQLFIVLIDKTATMHDNDNERINKVYSALMRGSVIDAFLPPSSGAKSGVVLVKFTTGTPTGLDNGAPRVITSRDEYKDQIRTWLLAPSGGYTNLYGAVTWSATDLLKVPEISNFINTRQAEPTIVLLTDGFHDEGPEDTCATNVPRLQAVIDKLRELRRGVGLKPRVFTVGLGTPYRKGGMPEGIRAKDVTAAALCGQYADYRIDGGLEKDGIDHVSLQWIAQAGGGSAFVANDSGGLADVFKRAAAARYRWFTVNYRAPDNFWHRQSFELRLTYGEKASTSVKIHPSAWLDAPTGEREGTSRWATPAPFRKSIAVLVSVLSTLILLAFVGPAMFNARRAVFRRIRPRKR